VNITILCTYSTSPSLTQFVCNIVLESIWEGSFVTTVAETHLTVKIAGPSLYIISYRVWRVCFAFCYSDGKNRFQVIATWVLLHTQHCKQCCLLL
jgi:hypothetical protein